MNKIKILILLLLSTTSGFSQWVMTHDLGGNFQKIFFPSDSVGYIIDESTHKRIFKTIDYGTTWTPLTPMGIGYPKDVFFIDDTIGFIST
jgi:photosystem II stability/assembly factor-like uncharacterized protein